MAFLRAQNNAVVRTEDPDILIIGLESMEKLPADKNILLETVLQTSNALRFVNIDKLH